MEVKIFSTLAGMGLKEWVKAARLHGRLTQDQLGDKLGFTKGNVSGWEVGRHEPSYGTLIKIIEVTGFSTPLPGLDSPIVVKTKWPFRKISEEKIESLDPLDLAEVEGVVVAAAAQLGLDVKKD